MIGKLTRNEADQESTPSPSKAAIRNQTQSPSHLWEGLVYVDRTNVSTHSSIFSSAIDRNLVETIGIEPTTFGLQSRRSPS
jgi:hypothetical protein